MYSKLFKEDNPDLYTKNDLYTQKDTKKYSCLVTIMAHGWYIECFFELPALQKLEE